MCQVLLECEVFEAVGTKVFVKNKRKDAFEDSRSALYRLDPTVSVCRTHQVPGFRFKPFYDPVQVCGHGFTFSGGAGNSRSSQRDPEVVQQLSSSQVFSSLPSVSV